METLPTSVHFELQTLADGVYAAIGAPGGAAFSNAGIIDLGGAALVFDAFDLPLAAKDLRLAAETLTGGSRLTLIISHFHGDHTGGSQVFDDCPIYATPLTRRLSRREFDGTLELQKDISVVENDLKSLETRLKEESDPTARASLESMISRTRYALQELPGMRLRLPDCTFTRGITFYGSKRKAVLRSTGRGHTSSDAALLLPAEKIAFIGDLGFFQTQPYMGSAFVPAWKSQLVRMQQSSYEVFVPGHGPLGKKEDLELEWQYLETLETAIARQFEAGASLETALNIELPEPFKTWQAGSMRRFKNNVTVLYRRLEGKK